LKDLLKEYRYNNFPLCDFVLARDLFWLVYPMTFEDVPFEAVEEAEEEGEDPIDGEGRDEGEVFVRDSRNQFGSMGMIPRVVG